LFKSKIFLKIISIFTLPILLILFYSAFLVYQKNIESKEIEVLKKNVIFVKNIKELIFAIDKEQNSTVKYLSTQKETLDLQKDYKSTNEAYDNLMNSVKILNLQLKVENLNYDIGEINPHYAIAK
jgi:CHASE3 domain sensor protein